MNPIPNTLASHLGNAGSLVTAYHGCDESIGKDLISGKLPRLLPSRNRYDWLGSGTYFFEKDHERARHFAEFCARYPDRKYSKFVVEKPFVVGAVIQLGLCLDLSTREGIIEAQEANKALRETLRKNKQKLPANKKAFPEDKDIIIRTLDRAIIEYLHVLRVKRGLAPYDTVRCAFPQGKSIAHTSAFREFSHVQIAVRNSNCVLGYHLPRELDADPFAGLGG